MYILITLFLSFYLCNVSFTFDLFVQGANASLSSLSQLSQSLQPTGKATPMVEGTAPERATPTGVSRHPTSIPSPAAPCRPGHYSPLPFIGSASGGAAVATGQGSVQLTAAAAAGSSSVSSTTSTHTTNTLTNLVFSKQGWQPSGYVPRLYMLIATEDRQWLRQFYFYIYLTVSTRMIELHKS